MAKNDIPMSDGWEMDALSHRAKKYYHWKPGARKWIKRKYNKRLRRDGKMQDYES